MTKISRLFYRIEEQSAASKIDNRLVECSAFDQNQPMKSKPSIMDLFFATMALTAHQTSMLPIYYETTSQTSQFNQWTTKKMRALYLSVVFYVSSTLSINQILSVVNFFCVCLCLSSCFAYSSTIIAIVSIILDILNIYIYFRTNINIIYTIKLEAFCRWFSSLPKFH